MRNRFWRLVLVCACVACQGDATSSPEVKQVPTRPVTPIVPGGSINLDPSLVVSVPDSEPVTIFAGDSLEVNYTTRNVDSVTFSCSDCIEFGRVARIGTNKILVNADISVPETIAGHTCLKAFASGVLKAKKCFAIHTDIRPGGLIGLPDSIRASELVSPHRLKIATYDNSGETVHPDIIRFKNLWNGWECVMSHTPYPNSNAFYENPSLAVSHDCENWIPAPGVAAPLEQSVGGYNSDSEMFVGDDGCLHIMFRAVTDSNTIYWAKSCAGPADWSRPRPMFAAINHRAVSPTIAVGPDGVRRMWYVDASFSGCGSRSNTVRMRVMTSDTTVGPEQTTNLVQPGYQIWHHKVVYVPERKQYWMIYAAYESSCGQNDLFIAIGDSTGTKWRTFPIPILSRFDNRFAFATLYRPAFLYDAGSDVLRLFPSALEHDRWGIFSGNWDRKRLFRHLYASLAADKSALGASTSLQRRGELQETPRLRRLINEKFP